MTCIYVLEWYWSDGYEHGNGVLGAYSRPSLAAEAYDAWTESKDDCYYMNIRCITIDGEIL